MGPDLDAALAAHPPARWAEIGACLVRAGLSERAVHACFGVRAVAHVPRAVAAGRRFGERPPPAAVVPWLLAGGGAVDAALARRVLADDLDALVAAGLLARDGELVRAHVAILPAGSGGALAVSDPSGSAGADAVLPPDDSSHHLVSALPRRRVERWLDLGTGEAWAPLAATGRATAIVAADLNPRAIAMARLGAALSGVVAAALELRVADLAAGIAGVAPRFDLVSFNAPIPGERGEVGPRHRVSPPGDDLRARFWAIAPTLLAPGGEVVVHAAIDDDPLAAVADLPGEVVIARYTPAGVAAFAITAWRPDRPPDRRVVEIALTAAAPHVPRAALG